MVDLTPECYLTPECDPGMRATDQMIGVAPGQVPDWQSWTLTCCTSRLMALAALVSGMFFDAHSTCLLYTSPSPRD